MRDNLSGGGFLRHRILGGRDFRLMARGLYRGAENKNKTAVSVNILIYFKFLKTVLSLEGFLAIHR